MLVSPNHCLLLCFSLELHFWITFALKQLHIHFLADPPQQALFDWCFPQWISHILLWKLPFHSHADNNSFLLGAFYFCVRASIDFLYLKKNVRNQCLPESRPVNTSPSPPWKGYADACSLLLPETPAGYILSDHGGNCAILSVPSHSVLLSHLFMMFTMSPSK